MPTPLERAALERALDVSVIVVQSSRAGSGRVALRRYLDLAGMRRQSQSAKSARPSDAGVDALN